MDREIILKLDQNDLAIIVKAMNSMTIGEAFYTAVKINQQINLQRTKPEDLEPSSDRESSIQR